MRLNTNKANLLLFIFGCVLALIGAEIFLRYYNPFQFRIKGDNIVLPIFFHYNFELKPSQKLDPVVSHSKNSLGFRGAEKPEDFENRLTIITVGGSTTECFLLSDGKTWPALLEEELSRSFDRVWINNAGLDGHSTFGHTILMKDVITKIKPKIVLFLIGANDRSLRSIQRFDMGLKSGLELDLTSIKTFLRTAGNYSEVFALGYNLYRYFKKVEVGFRHVELDLREVDVLEISKAKEQEIKRNKLQEHKENYLEGYESRLNDLIKISKENDIEPVFITQPVLFGDTKDNITGINLGTIKVGNKENGNIAEGVLEFYNEITRSVGKKNNVLVIDLAKEMPKSTQFYYDFLHYSNQGAKKVAEIIDNNLRPFLKNKYSGYSKIINRKNSS